MVRPVDNYDQYFRAKTERPRLSFEVQQEFRADADDIIGTADPARKQALDNAVADLNKRLAETRLARGERTEETIAEVQNLYANFHRKVDELIRGPTSGEVRLLDKQPIGEGSWGEVYRVEVKGIEGPTVAKIEKKTSAFRDEAAKAEIAKSQELSGLVTSPRYYGERVIDGKRALIMEEIPGKSFNLHYPFDATHEEVLAGVTDELIEQVRRELQHAESQGWFSGDAQFKISDQGRYRGKAVFYDFDMWQKGRQPQMRYTSPDNAVELLQAMRARARKAVETKTRYPYTPDIEAGVKNMDDKELADILELWFGVPETKSVQVIGNKRRFEVLLEQGIDPNEVYRIAKQRGMEAAERAVQKVAPSVPAHVPTPPAQPGIKHIAEVKRLAEEGDFDTALTYLAKNKNEMQTEDAARIETLLEIRKDMRVRVEKDLSDWLDDADEFLETGEGKAWYALNKKSIFHWPPWKPRVNMNKLGRATEQYPPVYLNHLAENEPELLTFLNGGVETELDQILRTRVREVSEYREALTAQPRMPEAEISEGLLFEIGPALFRRKLTVYELGFQEATQQELRRLGVRDILSRASQEQKELENLALPGTAMADLERRGFGFGTARLVELEDGRTVVWKFDSSNDFLASAMDIAYKPGLEDGGRRQFAMARILDEFDTVMVPRMRRIQTKEGYGLIESDFIPNYQQLGKSPSEQFKTLDALLMHDDPAKRITQAEYYEIIRQGQDQGMINLVFGAGDVELGFVQLPHQAGDNPRTYIRMVRFDEEQAFLGLRDYGILHQTVSPEPEIIKNALFKPNDHVYGLFNREEFFIDGVFDIEQAQRKFEPMVKKLDELLADEDRFLTKLQASHYTEDEAREILEGARRNLQRIKDELIGKQEGMLQKMIDNNGELLATSTGGYISVLERLDAYLPRQPKRPRMRDAAATTPGVVDEFVPRRMRKEAGLEAEFELELDIPEGTFDELEFLAKRGDPDAEALFKDMRCDIVGGAIAGIGRVCEIQAVDADDYTEKLKHANALRARGGPSFTVKPPKGMRGDQIKIIEPPKLKLQPVPTPTATPTPPRPELEATQIIKQPIPPVPSRVTSRGDQIRLLTDAEREALEAGGLEARLRRTDYVIPDQYIKPKEVHTEAIAAYRAELAKRGVPHAVATGAIDLEKGFYSGVFKGHIDGVADELALKVSKSLNPSAIKKFEQEARQLAEIQEVLPTPRSYGIVDLDGAPAIAMERFKGRPFKDRWLADGKINPEDFKGLITEKTRSQLEAGLRAAKQEGWTLTDVQYAIITEPQVLGFGKHRRLYEPGDVIFFDVGEWRKMDVGGQEEVIEKQLEVLDELARRADETATPSRPELEATQIIKQPPPQRSNQIRRIDATELEEESLGGVVEAAGKETAERMVIAQQEGLSETVKRELDHLGMRDLRDTGARSKTITMEKLVEPDTVVAKLGLNKARVVTYHDGRKAIVKVDTSNPMVTKKSGLSLTDGGRRQLGMAGILDEAGGIHVPGMRRIQFSDGSGVIEAEFVENYQVLGKAPKKIRQNLEGILWKNRLTIQQQQQLEKELRRQGVINLLFGAGDVEVGMRTLPDGAVELVRFDEEQAFLGLYDYPVVHEFAENPKELDRSINTANDYIFGLFKKEDYYEEGLFNPVKFRNDFEEVVRNLEPLFENEQRIVNRLTGAGYTAGEAITIFNNARKNFQRFKTEVADGGGGFLEKMINNDGQLLATTDGAYLSAKERKFPGYKRPEFSSHPLKRGNMRTEGQSGVIAKFTPKKERAARLKSELRSAQRADGTVDLERVAAREPDLKYIITRAGCRRRNIAGGAYEMLAVGPCAERVFTATTPEEFAEQDALAKALNEALEEIGDTQRIVVEPGFADETLPTVRTFTPPEPIVGQTPVQLEMPAVKPPVKSSDDAGMWAVPPELQEELPPLRPKDAREIKLTPPDLEKLRAAKIQEPAPVAHAPTTLEEQVEELDRILNSKAGRRLLALDKTTAEWYAKNRKPWYRRWLPGGTKIKTQIVQGDLPRDVLRLRSLKRGEHVVKQFVPSVDAMYDLPYEQLAEVRDLLSKSDGGDRLVASDLRMLVETEFQRKGEMLLKQTREGDTVALQSLARYYQRKYLSLQQREGLGSQLDELTELMLAYKPKDPSTIGAFFEHFPIELAKREPKKLRTFVKQAGSNAGNAVEVLARVPREQQEIFLDRMIALHKITGQDLGSKGYAFFPVTYLLDQPSEVFAFAEKYKEATGGMLKFTSGRILEFEERYADLAMRAREELGITHLFRYGQSDLRGGYDFSLIEEVLRNLNPQVNADKPLALFVVNKYDWNNAFRHIGSDIEEFRNTHKILIYEVDNKDDFFKVIQKAGELHGVDARGKPIKPIQLFMPAGHGERTSIHLGRRGSRPEIVGKELVTIEDKKQFEKVAPYFGKKAEIVPDACSVGSGRFWQTNIVKVMGKAIPQANVQGGRCPITAVGVEFGEELKFIFKKVGGEDAPVLAIERRIDESQFIPAIPKSEMPTVMIQVDEAAPETVKIPLPEQELIKSTSEEIGRAYGIPGEPQAYRIPTPEEIAEYHARKADPGVIEANRAAIGVAADHPKMRAALDDLTVPIVCGLPAATGRVTGHVAAEPCPSPRVIVRNPVEHARAIRVQIVMDELGLPRLRIENEEAFIETLDNIPAIDYNLLQTMYVLGLNPEQAAARFDDLKRIAAVYVDEVGLLDSSQYTSKLSKLVEEGVLTEQEYIRLRKGAPDFEDVKKAIGTTPFPVAIPPGAARFGFKHLEELRRLSDAGEWRTAQQYLARHGDELLEEDVVKFRGYLDGKIQEQWRVASETGEWLKTEEGGAFLATPDGMEWYDAHKKPFWKRWFTREDIAPETISDADIEMHSGRMARDRAGSDLETLVAEPPRPGTGMAWRAAAEEALGTEFVAEHKEIVEEIAKATGITGENIRNIAKRRVYEQLRAVLKNSPDQDATLHLYARIAQETGYDVTNIIAQFPRDIIESRLQEIIELSKARPLKEHSVFTSIDYAAFDANPRLFIELAQVTRLSPYQLADIFKYLYPRNPLIGHRIAKHLPRILDATPLEGADLRELLRIIASFPDHEIVDASADLLVQIARDTRHEANYGYTVLTRSFNKRRSGICPTEAFLPEECVSAVAILAAKYKEGTGGMIRRFQERVFEYEARFGDLTKQNLEQFGITHPHRYFFPYELSLATSSIVPWSNPRILDANNFDVSLLTENIRNLDPVYHADRPVALVIHNRFDWNGAFEDPMYIYQLRKLADGYKLFIVEVDTQADAFRQLQRIATLHGVDAAGKPKKPVSVLVIGGHGNPNALTLGYTPLKDTIQIDDLRRFDSQYLTVQDGAQFKTAAPFIKNNGEIVLVSCSTGAGGACATNLATTISENIPHARVHAPTVSTHTERFTFEDGVFKGVTFRRESDVDSGMSVGPRVMSGMTEEDLVKKVAQSASPDSLEKRVEDFFENPVKIGEAHGFEGRTSPLYDRVGMKNRDEVFQLSLEESLGPGIYGGKAVAYVKDDGTIATIFLTETGKTHHRHALAEVIGGEKGHLVYGGLFNDPRLADLPERTFGFEFQYDKNKGKIISINHKSQVTTIQISKGARGWKLKKGVVDRVEQELLDQIDPLLFDDPLLERPVDTWINRKELPISP